MERFTGNVVLTAATALVSRLGGHSASLVLALLPLWMFLAPTGSASAAAPTLSETVMIVVEGGTTTNFMLAGSDLDGATLAESDADLDVAVNSDFSISEMLSVDVTLAGNPNCPSWWACPTDVTVTTSEGSDTFTIYRVNSDWVPTIDFSVDWSMGQTTATATFVEGATMDPPFSSGLWNNGAIVLTLKPVRTGEPGYDPDPNVCGGPPNDCAYGINLIASVTDTESFEGLTPGTQYSAVARLQASAAFTGTPNFDAFGGTASPFTAQTDAPTARTISLADATTTADQSVTLAATVSAGDGTVTYTVTDGTATGCGISGTALTVNTPGTCTVTASVPASGTYAAASTTATMTFTAATRTLALADQSAPVTDAITLAATPSAGEGVGTITYAVTTGGTATGCSVAGDQLTATGPGTCNVSAEITAAGAYSAASATATMTFTAATRTLTLESQSAAATEAITLAATPSAGVGVGTITYAVTAGGTATGCSVAGDQLTANGPGTCNVSAEITAAGAYSAASATATMTFTAATRTLTLDNQSAAATEAITLAATPSAGVGLGTITYAVTAGGTATGCSVAGDQLTANGPGTCNVSAEITAAGAYSAASATATMTFTGEVLQPETEGDGTPMDPPPGDAEALVDGQPVTVTTEVVLDEVVLTAGPVSIAVGASKGSDSVTPASDGLLTVTADATVAVSGSGFEPGSDVAVWVFSSPTLLGTTTVGSDGSFSGTFSLPAGISEGEHSVQADGVAADGSTRSMSLGIRIVPDDPTQSNGISLKGPSGDFYELQPDTAAVLEDTDGDGIASASSATFEQTDTGVAADDTGSDLALQLDPADGSEQGVSPSGSITFVQGGNMVARGFGYQAGATIEVWVASTPQLLGTATVGTDGQYELQVPVPADLVPGNHTVQSEGVADGGVTKAISIGVTVSAANSAPVAGVPARIPTTPWLILMLFAFGVAVLGVRQAAVADSHP